MSRFLSFNEMQLPDSSFGRTKDAVAKNKGKDIATFVFSA